MRKFTLLIGVIILAAVYAYALNQSPATGGVGQVVTCEQAAKEAAPLLEKEDEASLKRVIEIYGQVLSRQSDCVPALVGYARAVTVLGGFSIKPENYLLAFEYLARVFVLAPDNTEAYWAMADLQRRAGHADRALKLAEKAAALAPKDPYAHFIFGSILINSNRAEAMKELQTALDLKPGWSKAQFNLAAVQIQNGAYAEALKNIEAYIAANPGNVGALTNLGIVYLRLNKVSDAEASLKKALDLNPRFGNALKSMGDVNVAKKDYAKAVEFYRLALVSMPGDPSLYAFIGDAQIAAGQPDEAVASYKKALGLKPDNVEWKKKIEALEAKKAGTKKAP